MKLITIIYILSAFLLNTSCVNKTTSRTSETSNVSQNLVAEVFYPNEIFDVSFMSIIDKKLIIASLKSDTAIYMYDLDKLTLKHKFGKKGEGPDDILVPRLYNTTTNCIMIGGYDRSTSLCKFIEKENVLEKTGRYKITANREPMNNIHLSDSSTIFYNDIFNLQIKAINIAEDKETTITKFKTEDHKEPFFYSNKGCLAVGDKCFAYAYTYKDKIDFFDLEGNLIKTDGDDKTTNITLYRFDDNIISYVNMYATKHYFYALFRGKTNAEYKNSNKKDTLKVFNAKGEYIKSFTFDVSPILFAVDENDEILIGYDSEREALLKFKLK